MRLSLSYLKMAFGFSLLIVMGYLAYVIAVGKVYQESSFGLQVILGGLLSMSGGFVNWAFGESRTSSNQHGDTHGH